MEKEFKITFLPDEKHVFVIGNTSVYEAANRAGILLSAPCGGEGRCGKCRVRVLKGSVSKPSARESSALSPGDIKAGIRLSCQTSITGECSIEIPPASRIEAYNILVSGRMKSVKIDSGLSKTFIPSKKPGLGDHPSYLGIIRKKASFSKADIDVLRSVPGLLPGSKEGITAAVAGDKLIALESSNTVPRAYGAAVDLGTTTLAVTLLNLNTGEELGSASRLNPQIKHGSDLITRINFAGAKPGNFRIIHDQIILAVNEMIGELSLRAGISLKHIYKLAAAGNTGMQNIFCGINPGSLGRIPFIPAVREAVKMKASDAGIDICPGGEVYVFPAIGGFVGGDSVSAILASGMNASKKIRILIDIGTNGEIIAGSNEKLICASAAAGPAFESARIEMGTIARAGAIEKVLINEDVHVNVIGNIPPSGICGSGLIDAAAQMLNAGIIDASGRMLSKKELAGSVPGKLLERIISRAGRPAFVLSPKDSGNMVYITQGDIRELQLAKSAIYSAVKILKRALGVKLEDVEEVLIAGAFGNFIRRKNARRIGLIPNLPSGRIKFIGNASSSGAKLLLLSREIEKEAEKISNSTEHLELASSGLFHREFAENMLFPE